MRVVFDTNVLISGLLSAKGPPGRLLNAWLDRRFTLLICRQLMVELRETTRKSSFVKQLRSAQIGRLVKELKIRATYIDSLPFVMRSSDPEDNFILALAEAGKADYLVSGDKSGLLALHKHAGARIVTAREFLDQIS